MNESAIQKAIMARLAWHPLIYVIKRASKHNPDPIDRAARAFETGERLVLWRQNTGGAKLPGKGGRPQHVAFNLKGAPDIFGFMAPGGRCVGMEVKTEKGRQSDSQVSYETMMVAAGGLYEIVRSPDEAVVIVEGWLAQ